MPDSSRTALGLCLAGGGYPGAVFEFGAVAALDDALDGWSPANSSIIVGTSCGALVGAVLGMGVEGSETRDALNDGGAHPLSLTRRNFSRVPWTRHLHRLFRRTDRGLSRQPIGLFSNSGIEDLLHRVQRWKSKADSFEDLLVPLSVVATTLDSGAREVFGMSGTAAPVSRAVCASTAIPGYFEPVRVHGRDYIDGQIADPVHLDLVAGHGTRAALVVSPLTTYEPGPVSGGLRIRDLGVSAVMDQSARISATVKARAARNRFQRDHPDIPCVFVSPEPAETITLIRGGFDAVSVRNVWELGYRSTRRVLEADADGIAGMLAPLGVSLNLAGLDSP